MKQIRHQSRFALMTGEGCGTYEVVAVSTSRKGGPDMRTTLSRFTLALLVTAHCSSQTPDYSPQNENALQKIKPGKQLYKEDEPCGQYFWKTLKATAVGPVALYYFFGSTEYGKGKMGLYPQPRYRVAINEEKDPPTAQAAFDSKGLKEVRVQMTQREFDAAGQCFPAAPAAH
jgi:hypothetical protein